MYEYFIVFDSTMTWPSVFDEPLLEVLYFNIFGKISNIRRTKSQNFNEPRLVLHLSLAHFAQSIEAMC